VRRKDRQIEDSSAIMHIFQKADVCRIAMCDDNVPYIVTMNFGFGKNGATSLYFHSSCEGKKINFSPRRIFYIHFGSTSNIYGQQR
jgi:uncharacterized protein